MGRIEMIEDAGQELNARHYEHLEAGGILLFPQLSLDFSDADLEFLLRQRQTRAGYHKNIAYRSSQDRLTGVARGSDLKLVRHILKAYSQMAEQKFSRLLPRYAENSRLEFTSFRPFEEEGRPLSLHSRNDLLHVDAFPTRPTNGNRILRFFTNLNPTRPRVWLVSNAFDQLARRYAVEAGLLEESRRTVSALRRAVSRVAGRIGLHRLAASPYDAMMHRFHNYLKESHAFQATATKERVEFPPKSSWLVFTDMASHAVLAGQFALEQTFIVSRRTMIRPDLAPVSILEGLAGVPLTWPD